ncbi:MAG: LCP family protein [Rhodoglobus sp.]
MSEVSRRSAARSRGSRAQPSGIARHGRLRKASPVGSVVKFLAAGLAVLLVSSISVGAIAVNGLTSKVKTVDIPTGKNGPLPEVGAIEGGFNILIVGNDTRDGQGGVGGTTEDAEGELNDVTILLHVSEDQSNAVVVSFPRDLVVGIPECENSDGDTKSYSTEPINTALSYGGLSCVAQTVTDLTGLDIQYAGLIKFQGVIAMGDAIGGVDVCVDGPMIDDYTGINIEEAGTYTLMGVDALNFLRSRHAVGDGSDLTRIDSQQSYLSSLVRKLQNDNILGDLKKVFGLANAALSNMTLSTSLGNVTTMVSIAQALKNIPPEKVTFVRYPGFPGDSEGAYAGKVTPDEIRGEKLMSLIADDIPFTLSGVDDRGAALDPSAPVTPTDPAAPAPDPSAPPSESSEVPVLDKVSGQTAAERTCTVTNDY